MDKQKKNKSHNKNSKIKFLNLGYPIGLTKKNIIKKNIKKKNK